MKRREFLRGLSGTLAALALPKLGATVGDPWAEGFASGLRSDRRLAAYAGITADRLATLKVTLEGKIPRALRGTFYRNGPARFERDGVRCHHWFDGDGMVHAFRLSDAGVSHVGRMVHTEKYVAESRAARFLRPMFGTRIAGAERVPGADALNTANTNVLPYGGEVLALWEGGSAYSLDAQTLKTRGPKVWRDDLKGMPFSAHPRVDVDGTLWNFGINASQGLLALYRISPLRRVLVADVLRVPGIAMVHDFAITARHMVFLLPPFRFETDRMAAGAPFLDCHVWLPGEPLRILVLDKTDWSRSQMLEVDSAFVFHLGNAWEDRTGVIRFDYVRYHDPTVLTRDIPNRMRGAPTAGGSAQVVGVTLDVRKRRVVQERVPGDAEFPRVDSRRTGARHRHLYSLICNRDTGGLRTFNAVRRLDLETGATDVFDYGPGYIAEEHIPVPRPGSDREADGWVLGTAFDVKRGVTVLSVFEAKHISAGPIARATLPYAIPLGLHGNFASAI